MDLEGEASNLINLSVATYMEIRYNVVNYFHLPYHVITLSTVKYIKFESLWSG